MFELVAVDGGFKILIGCELLEPFRFEKLVDYRVACTRSRSQVQALSLQTGAALVSQDFD
jgi:hypothetical protein